MAKTVTVPVPTLGARHQNALLWIMYIIIFLIILAIAWRIYKTAQNAANAAGTLLDQQAQSNALQIDVARLTVIRNIAADAHKAIWGEKLPAWNIISYATNGGWSASTEDEAAFIAAVNRLATVNEVSYFNDQYKAIGGHSAKADCEQYLSGTDIRRIKTVVYQNLN